MVRESPAVTAQVVDPTAGVAYTLTSRASGFQGGPYVLWCISLRTGDLYRGPVFRASGPATARGLALASGYLWVAPTLSQQVVSQVDPRDLTVVRSLRLPKASAMCDPGVTVAPGPGGSVWIGSFHVLVRVDTVTGSIVSRAALPSGAVVSDIAVDPARRHLYLSITRAVRGGCEGDAVLEYGARIGQRLAVATHGVITYSLAGAWLTAVPGGVWASFRGGMLGFTIHLRQRDLAMTVPASPRIALRAGNGLFRWAIDAVTAYGGGALWVATASGLVACLDPRTGQTRAIERVPQSSGTPEPLAADRASGQLFAAGPYGLVRITPATRVLALGVEGDGSNTRFGDNAKICLARQTFDRLSP
jgi:outer membrane protein assembly factor BamB